MKLREGISLDYDDVLILPQRSTIASRKDVILEREFKFYHSPKTWVGVPIICSNMVPLTTWKMCEAFVKEKMIVALHKYYSVEDLHKFLANFPPEYVWISIGMNEKDLERLKILNDLDYNIIVDVANAHLETFVEYCRKVRSLRPNSIICAGNVSNPSCVSELILHGKVDIVKIFTGPGKMCKTRHITGVGCGSVSCIDECSHIAHGLKSREKGLGLVCADGGCKYPGDIAKGFCVGSDFIMVGSLFSGTSECDGEWIYENDLKKPIMLEFGRVSFEQKKKALKFYGMSTHLAQELHGEKKDYRASEGSIKEIPYKGPVSEILKEIQGGLRSCGTYIGATELKNFPRCAEFVRVNKIHQET